LVIEWHDHHQYYSHGFQPLEWLLDMLLIEQTLDKGVPFLEEEGVVSGVLPSEGSEVE